MRQIRLFLRSRSEERRDQLCPGDAVDHAVMHLREDGQAVSFEALDKPQFPERFLAIEALREDATHHSFEYG